MIRLALPLFASFLLASAAAAAPSEGATETVEQALCRLIEGSAKARALPVPFLTRLIWRESSFKVGVVSPAGAQGVAQFMPGTARERGLLDPFDPEQAIPHAAHLLADLNRQFGNLGLAAAAYNGGPTRVANWLAGSGGLPTETRAYVYAITGRPAEDWRPGAAIEMGAPEGGTAKKEPAKGTEGKAGDGKPSETKPSDGRADEARAPDAKASDAKASDAKAFDAKASDAKASDAKTSDAKTSDSKSAGTAAKVAAHAPPALDGPQTCLQVTAALRIPSRGDRFALGLNEGPAAPWGIQLAGNFSKALALRSFSLTRSRYAGVIGEVRPMIIGTRLRYRGTRAFYRVRIPADSRNSADALCGRIRAVGGACVVLKT